jgi:hypothetical protein
VVFPCCFSIRSITKFLPCGVLYLSGSTFLGNSTFELIRIPTLLAAPCTSIGRDKTVINDFMMIMCTLVLLRIEKTSLVNCALLFLSLYYLRHL